jgi:hypothetical protein
VAVTTSTAAEGPNYVLDVERVRLLAGARPDLADRIVHVAIVEGDSAGYDIRSYELDGTPMLTRASGSVPEPEAVRSAEALARV